MNWLHYLLEANLYLAVFYAGYYLFLRRETYYTLNRIYLLFSCIASFALPVMQLGVLKPVERPITTVQFSYTTQAATSTFIPVHVAPAAPVFTWQDGVVDVYLFGAAVLLVVLLVKLYQLLRLTRVKNPGTDGNYKVIHLNESDTAFSFFNYLFIGTKVQQAEMIIKHELVHIKQKHSADIIFTELLKIVNWFNPFIYLLQYSLREIHEYIADEKIATSGTDALTYSSFLVSNACGLSGSSITHSFFNYNLLKKRIIMLHQKRSGSLARLRYLLAIPICGGLLCASTLAFSKTYGWVDIAPHHSINANTTPQAHVVRDTDKTHIPPPPPPAPPVKRVKFPAPIVRPSTPKGYPYSEAGYTENGKSDIEVTIYEKNGSHKEYDKNKATAADLALLKEKYGYVFPAHLRMPPPPPPPAPPKHMAHKLPPPVVVPDGKIPPPPPVVVPDGKTPPPPVIRHDTKLPPPPPPFEGVYKSFFFQIAKTTIYPKAARMHNTAGYVVVQYTLNNKHQISAAKIYKSSDPQFNAPVIAAITNYKGTIDKDAGDYTVGIRFSLEQDQNNDKSRDIDSKMMESPNCSGIIVITATSITYNQLAPPPPTAPENSVKTEKAQINRDEAPDNITLNGITVTRNRPINYKASNPLLIINGTKYYTIGKMDNQTLNFAATDSAVVFKDDKVALAKLGPDAKKGAFYLYGKVEISVLSHGSIAK